MPYQQKCSSAQELAELEQAIRQSYLIDPDGRFSLQPVALDYLFYCEQHKIPYLLAMPCEEGYILYVDLWGRRKWTVAGFSAIAALAKACGNLLSLSADNAALQIAEKDLTEVVQKAYSIASQQTSDDFIKLEILRKGAARAQQQQQQLF